MYREDLLQKVKTSRPSVTVFGIGGAGCNITTGISDKKLTGGKIIAANTDANHLSTMTRADKIMLLGEKLCKGYGCGGYPERGAQAAKENISEIKQELEGTNLLFVVAGLGGGSGTGAIPVVAAAGREAGALTIACVTIPFTIEMSRREKARDAVKSLAEVCDSIVVIDNSKLREVAGNLPLKDALAVANALVGSFVKNLTDTITQPSLVNLDYADLRAVMERGGIASIGIGEGDGENRVEKAVSQAISTPLLDITDISTAYGVLIHIVGGEDMTLDEVAIAGEQIMDKVPNTKRVIWGAKVDQNLTGVVRVMAVLTGVTCPFIGEVETKKETARIPKEVVKPLREAMEQMAKAQEIPKSTGEKQSRMEIIKKAAVFSKER
jgi:cell division protein FtsZ